MYARVAKPKLSLNTTVNSTTSAALKSPGASLSIPRTPLSPAALSPPAPKTPRAMSFHSRQQPSYSYANSCSSSKSILKKSSPSTHPAGGASKRIQFKGEPVVHPITPIEDRGDYYGKYVKMSRDERRWSRLSES